MFSHGYGWAALQADDFNNQRFAAAFGLALSRRGLLPGIWETAPTERLNQQISEFHAQFYIGEVESLGDYLALVGTDRPAVPHAIITNFNGLDSGRAEQLRNKGYKCMPEVYTGENPQATREAQVDYAHRVLGWPFEDIIPVYGTYQGKTLADFDTGLYHCVWSAEYVYS